MQGQIAQETVLQNNIDSRAQTEPKRYAKEIAEYNAGWVNTTMPTIFNTLLGGAVSRIAGPVGSIELTGKGAAIAKLEQAVGEAGGVGRPPPVPGKSGRGPSGYEVAAVKAEGKPVASTGVGLAEEGAIGGIPQSQVAKMQQAAAEINAEATKKFGESVEMGAGFRPLKGTPKAGARPKYELVKVKNGAEGDLKLGMPKTGLKEPVIYEPIDPRTLPDWKKLPTVEQKSLLKLREERLAELADFESDTPSPEMAKLKSVLGQRGEVELSHGRTATGEFAEHKIGPNARTIRVKHYEVRNAGEVEGTVYSSSETPQVLSYDVDGVAIYNKATGTRFPRQVENFINQRWRAKMSKLIREGDFAGSEHGFTLIADDLTAKNAGGLIHYGLKHLPEATARAVANRIAPYVGLTPEQILHGIEDFGQHVVNISATDAYLGELPLSSW
jgi:hypothetical protein